MFSIQMGGYDVVLGEYWLQTLGLVTMEFQELYIIFNKSGHKHTLKWIKPNSFEIISIHHMEKLLKK
jgi:hypothetical protein